MYTADNSRIPCLCPCFLHKHYPEDVEHKELFQTNTMLILAHDDFKNHRNSNRGKTTANSENLCVTRSPKPEQNHTALKS